MLILPLDMSAVQKFLLGLARGSPQDDTVKMLLYDDLVESEEAVAPTPDNRGRVGLRRELKDGVLKRAHHREALLPALGVVVDEVHALALEVERGGFKPRNIELLRTIGALDMVKNPRSRPRKTALCVLRCLLSEGENDFLGRIPEQLMLVADTVEAIPGLMEW